MIKKLEVISLDRIKDPERPMRSNLTPESLDELVFSIKEVGIIQPLVVCKTGESYEVIAGHRRLMAAELAGLIEAPCIVVQSSGLDKELLKMHENMAREDINPIDWANHLTYLKTQFHISNAKMAETLGFSEAWISQHLDIFNYPVEVLEAIKHGTLSFSAARELAQIKDPIKRKVYVTAGVKSGVTPDQAANWRREANTPEYKAPETAEGVIAQNGENPAPLALLICPVCNTGIEYADLLTLQIHRDCAPKSE
jgi:ParB family transcriptional regulator, chromosome partitioning protein